MTIIQSISRSILLIIGITISITILAQIPSNVPQNGLLAYYAFNGNTNDLSGNNNHLTNNNATLTSDRSGNTNTAYAFNGTNSYLEGPKTLGNLTTTTELSVSFWAKGNAGAFISKYWNLDFTRSSFSVGNNRISGDGTNYLDYVGSNSSDWKHYLVTYKAGSNNSKIYINGTLVTQGTLNLNSSSSTLTPFTIGRVWSSPENYLNGSFDELAVFDRVLTATEIAALSSIVITPSVSLSLDKTTISEKSGKASLLATLNKVVAKDTLINLTTSGSAINDLDYKFSYPSKGIPSLLATTNGRNYSTQDYPTSLAIGKNLETYLVDRAVSTIYMLKNGNSTLEEFLKFGRDGCSTCLNWPDLIRTDPQGNIYVSESIFVQKIVKIDPITKAISPVAGNNGKGTGLDQFMYISDFVVDKNQNIYVVDNGRIMKWAPNATEGTIINFSSTAVHIDLDKENNIYVSDNTGKIFKLVNNITEVVIGGQVLGKNLSINAFKVDKFKNILISEGSSSNQNSPRIIKWFNGDNHAETIVGDAGIGTTINQLKNPIDLAIDSVGNVSLLDNTNFRIVGIPLANQIKILSGKTSGSVDIVGIDDSVDEADESIGIEVKNGNNYSTSATLSITSDDLPPSIALQLSSNALEEAGSAITLTGRLSKKSAKTITANLSFAGTATKTTDYTLSSEVLTFAPGDSIKTITITPVNDTDVEVLETIVIAVASSTNLSTTYPTAISINLSSDDNAGITLSFDKTTISEKSGKAILTATLAAPTSKDVVINFKALGTSENEYDYNINFSTKGNARTVAGGNGQGNNANQLSHPKGIFLSGNGVLYVADSGNSRIQKFEPNKSIGTTVAGGYGYGSVANMLKSPSAVYVDPQENIFVADFENHRVQKWVPGAITGTTIAGGNGSGSNANQFYYPNGIVGDSSGNIYVNDSENARIQKWVPGAITGTTIAGVTSQIQFRVPYGLSIDLNNNLFIADHANHRIVMWHIGDANGKVIAGSTSGGSSSDQLNSPYGIANDNSGNVYISDQGNNRIQKWKIGDSFGLTVGGGNGGGSNMNQLWNPWGVAVDNFGNVFAADFINDRVQYYQYQPQIIIPAGQTTGTLELVGLDDNLDESDETITLEAVSVENGSMPTSAVSLTITSDDLAPTIALELSASTLSEDKTAITLTGRLSKKSAKTITANLSFAGTATKTTDYTLSSEVLTFAPWDSIATVTITPINDADVEVIENITLGISTSTNLATNYPTISLNIISEDKPSTTIALDKTSISEVGGKAILTATLSAPTSKDVVIDLTVSGTSENERDFNLNFSTKGSIKTVAGGNGAGNSPNQLSKPLSIFIDKKQNLYIGDEGNHRIQKWAINSPEGVTVAGGNGYGNNLNQIANPISIFVDNNENIYFSDAGNHRVQKWPPGAIRAVTVAGGNGSGNNSNQLSNPIGIFLDKLGNIIVADQSNYRIQKWAPNASFGITVAGGNGQGLNANQFANPTGVFIDNYENLFVSDLGNHRIQKWFNSATQGITVAGGNGQGFNSNQFYNPIGIIGDGKDIIYINDLGNYRIQKWSIGSSKGITVAGGNGYGSNSNQFANAYGVTIDDYLNLYIADTDNHRIQKYQYQPQIIIPAGQTTGTLEVVGLDDNLDETNETITLEAISVKNGSMPTSPVSLTITSDDLPPTIVLELSASTLSEDKTAITLTGRLSKKSAKTITANLSFAGTATKTTDYTLSSEVLTFAPGDSIKTITINPVNDTDVEVLETIVIAVASSTNLSTAYPTAVSINLSSDDNAGITLSFDKTTISEKSGKAILTATLAAPTSKNVVINFASKGNANFDVDYNINFKSKGIKTVAGDNSIGNALNQTSYPWGLALDKAGNLYVAENNSGRILKWKPGANSAELVVGQFGQGSASNQINRPHDIFIDLDDNLYIADNENRRVQKWAPGAIQGVTVAGGNGIGSKLNQIYSPVGIFVDNAQNVYVADQDNHRVVKWAPNSTSGIIVAGGNGAGGATNQLYYPRDVYVDNNSNVFVVEGGGRISKWSLGAKEGILVVSGLDWPIGLDVDQNGTFYFTDANKHRVLKRREGQNPGIVIAGGNGQGSNENQLNTPAGIVLDPYSNLYISDYNNHRIQKIQNQPQIIIPAGQTTGTLEVVGLDDNLDEADETITLEAVSVENGLMPTSAVSLTISSDDLAPTITLELSSANLDEDKTAVTLTARLSKKAGKPIKANLSFAGTATKGTDYSLSSETLTFAAGDSVATITITPINDTAIEIAETIQIGVASATGLDTNYPSINLNLLSEDKPGVSIASSTNSINEIKGQSILTATLSAPTAKDVYIDLNLRGTATFDKDYQVIVPRKGIGQLLFEKGGKYGNTNLSLPQTIAVDSANNLWVYENNNKLLKMDPNRKEVLKEINTSLKDLQITSDGIVHTMSMGGNITRYNLNGDLLDSFVLNNGVGNVVSFSFSNGHYYFFNLNNMTFYKVNYLTKVQTSLGSIPDINLNIYKMVVTDNETIVFADRSQIVKYKNSVRTNLIDYAKYGDVSNPYIQLLSNGNILLKREPWPFNSSWDFNLEEFDLNGNRVKTWLNKTQSPIQNEFTGLGSFAVKPGKTDLYLSYYIEPNKLGTDYDKYNRNQIYQFPYKPSIKIPAGQTTGTLTFEGIEDLENESTESIEVKFGTVQNANNPTGTVPNISITDNRISFTAQNINIPALTESALSWGDYDRDGDQDLAIMGFNDGTGYQTAVWRNDNGTFVNTFQNLIRTANGDIKWFDINKDGYLDLICSGVAIDANDATSNKTVIYFNNKKGGLINAGSLNVPELSGTKIALGDLDNDGDLDIAILGYNSNDQAVFYLYEKNNTELIYSRINDFIAPTLSGTNADWDLKIADFDLDGDNDILFRGGTITNSFVETSSLNFNINYTGLKYEVVKLYNRTGPLTVLAIGQENGVNKFFCNETISFIGGVPTLSEGDIAAGDFNNDGLNDLVVTGADSLNNPKTLLYYQRPDSQFELMPNIALEGLLNNSTADWVDYDVDGDLDLILTGRGTQAPKTILYKNNTGTKVNRAPNVPFNLRVVDKGNGFVELAWDTPSDDYSTFLGYNIRLGKTPGGTELSNTQSNLETGSRLITAPAPIYGNTYTTQLSPGQYYWSVQAIDQGFQASPFAPEKQILLQYEWKTVNQKNIINRTIAGATKSKILMVDFDNDKDLDMIVGSSIDRRVYSFNGNMYVPSSISIGSGGVDNMVAEDINGDGKMDLVINSINGSSLSLHVYFSTGYGYNLVHTMSYNSLVNSKIKVIDLDNDGLQEVLIAGSTSLLSNAETKVYRLEYAGPQDPTTNPTGASFYEAAVSLVTGMTGITSYDFGDINNDSKIDLIISGKTGNGLKTKIYLNNSAVGQTGDLTFLQTSDNLVATSAGTTDLMDYDADGDLDILQTGTSGNGDVFRFYENTLTNNLANFAAVSIGIDPIRNSKVRYGDFNGDGYYDLFFNGTRTNVSGQVNQLVQYNTNTKTYSNSTFNNGNLTNIEFAFADIEADGDLDLIITGDDATNANNKLLNVYLNVRNESAALNTLANNASNPSKKRKDLPSANRLIDTPPVAYLGTAVSYNLNNKPSTPSIKDLTTSTVNNQKILSFAWNKSSDDHTPASGLTYNLRIGTTTSNDNILASNAASDGVLKIPMEGNAEHNLSMNLKNLKDGTYYWSVQAIDASFSGSAFSTPKKFEIISGSLKASNAPVVADGSSTISSSINQATVIANLSASDPDGDALSYSFVSGNESGIFGINNGQLILLNKPTIFLDPYVLVISVSDGSNSKTLTYRIKLCESNFESNALHNNITKTYKSKDSLKGSAKLQGNSNVTMEAPKSIELKPGFVAEKGTVFKANIGPGCN